MPAETVSDSITKKAPFLAIRVDGKDSWLTWTLLAAGAAAIAVTMAVIGLPPLDLHTPLYQAGIMSPLCGGTRSIRLAAMGQWGESLQYNPLGLLVFLLCVALIARAGIGLVTGRWYTLAVTWTRRRAWIVVSVVAALVIALEIRQQSIAPFLMSS